MKTVLRLLLCFIIAGFPLMALQAADEQQMAEGAVTASDVTDDAGNETEVDRVVFAKSLFEGRCQMCHQLPEPSMLRPKQWRLILGTMQQRMQQAGVPPLTEDETERLLEYLALHAEM